MRYNCLIVLCLVAIAVKQSASKYTTLLEDERGDETLSDATRPTSVSYGRLIYDGQQADQSPTQETTAATGTDSNNANSAAANNGGGNTNNGNDLNSNSNNNSNSSSSNNNADTTNHTPKSKGSGDEDGGAKNGNSATFFSRLYSKISSYLPFIAQLTHLRQGGTNATSASSDYELHAKPNVSVSLARDMSRKAGDATEQKISDVFRAEVEGEVGTKNGASNNQAGSDTRNSNNNNGNIDYGTGQDNQQAQNNDKQQQQLRVRVSMGRKKVNDDDEDDNQNQADSNHDDQRAVNDNFLGQFANEEEPVDELAGLKALNERLRQQQLLQRQLLETPETKGDDSKRDRAQRRFLSLKDVDRNTNTNNNDDADDDADDTANRAELDVDMSQMVPVAIGLGNLQGYLDQTEQADQQQPIDAGNRYNMMKQSNLVLPYGSASDVLARTTSGTPPGATFSKQPESLLGRYIYAPTQHYYLNSVVPPSAPHSVVGHDQRHHDQASGGKHIQPGNQIYSSYGPELPMKAAYAYQKDHNSIVGKPNDFYFLVMVGAFCMMAMTVVLAAGLFAYRIQQNRKSSQDTGYPTYGVVGPNNMSAKYGAASFVGGYFTGPPGGGGSSKSGSAKHLADLYGTPNGTGGSDSGLNSLDKSSSNKKASSVSSLNEFHQSASSRTPSSNFMAAASQDAARMYHYQHQKQQMMLSDRSSGGRQTASDLDSEDDNDDGSYTVYECPGLASAHEMEIKNPLFNDDQSP